MILKSRLYFYLVTINYLLVTGFLAACGGTTEQSSDQPQQTSEPEARDRTTQNPEQAEKNILFFGDSLTAGLGLEEEEAYPALIQEKIDSLGLPYRSINAGLSGETSAGGLERVDWLLQQPISIFVLALGANDGLRGIAPEATYQNLSAIVEKVKAAHPDSKLLLAGMKIPPSMGSDYFDQFEAIYPRLAEGHQMTLIPFLLDGVAGIQELNQSDGIHPTAAGQRMVAELVWQRLKPLL